MKKDIPAFPSCVTDTGLPMVSTEGMTLRDYFAAKAMHQLLLNWSCFDCAKGEAPFKQIAEGAYNVADAMLAARNK